MRLAFAMQAAFNTKLYYKSVFKAQKRSLTLLFLLLFECNILYYIRDHKQTKINKIKKPENFVR